jgi:hypothetical protein
MPTIGIEGQYNKGAAAPINRPIQVDTNGNLIITPLAGSTTDVNITKIAGTAVAAGAGNVTAGSLRIVLSADDAHLGAVGAAADVDGHIHGQLRFMGDELDDIHDECIDILSSVQAMDDWDESDRCKVNPIAGQAGIAAGAGAVDLLTTRVISATDSPDVTALQVIDNCIGTNATTAPSQVAVIAGVNIGGDGKSYTLGTGGGNVSVNTLTVTIADNDSNMSKVVTSVELLDDAIYTDGTGTPSKGILVMGHDGTNPQAISVNSDGELKVNLETADIEIGAVEIKNATDDTRATVNANGLCVDINGQTLTAVKISKDANANLVTNPIFTQLSQDGTNAVAAATPLPISATMAANAAGNTIFVSPVINGSAVAAAKPMPVSATEAANAVGNTIFISPVVNGSAVAAAKPRSTSSLAKM